MARRNPERHGHSLGSTVFRDEGMVGGHWGSAGSGLLLTTGTKVLLAFRSGGVREPMTWSYPGGAIPVNEHGERRDALSSAKIEFREEMGRLPPMQGPIGVYVYRDGDFTYTTFVMKVRPSAERTDFRLNWENIDWAWFERDELEDLELHHGTEVALDELEGCLWSEL